MCDATGQIVVLDKQFKEQRRWLGWDTQATTELAKEETAGYNLGLVPGSKARKINHEKGLILIECGGLLIGIGVSVGARACASRTRRRKRYVTD